MDRQLELLRIHFIINPEARHGEGSAFVSELDSYLTNIQKQIDTSAALTTPFSFNISLSCEEKGIKDLVSESSEFDIVAIVGGDGSVSEAAESLMMLTSPTANIDNSSQPLPSPLPALAVVPFGSGNDFARTIGISLDPLEAVSQILLNKTKRIDIGQANDRYFIQTFSFGFDAAIARRAHKIARRRSRGMTGSLLYIRAAIEVLLHEYQNYRVSFRTDAEPWREKTVLLFAVGNGRSFGGGIPVTPHARLDDGHLDVCYAEGPLNRLAAVTALLRLLFNKHTSAKRYHSFQTDHLHVKSDTTLIAQADGERYESKTLDIRIIPDALTIIVP